jgi:hypothetical protein
MRYQTAVVAAAVFLGLQFAGRAQETTFLSMGSGGKSCGAYLQAAASERKLRPPTALTNEMYDMDLVAFINYANGFLTGVNWFSSTDRMVGQNSDTAGKTAWLENYCRAHPLDEFIVAVIALRQELIRTGK